MKMDSWKTIRSFWEAQGLLSILGGAFNILSRLKAGFHLTPKGSLVRESYPKWPKHSPSCQLGFITIKLTTILGSIF